MAIMIPSKSSDHHFSISNIISRFRSKKPKHQRTQTPQDTRPALNPAPLPLVLPEHQHTLSNLGWTSITFPQPSPSSSPNADSPDPGPHPLQTAYENLFLASQEFFNQPVEQKQQWKHKLGSEEGWSAIPGEKEFITLRTLEYCPTILRAPAKRYWDLMGAHLSNTLSQISSSIGLPSDSLTRFVGPCASLQATDDLKTATMLRLFRYEGWEAKVVAEPHADLGLLSVVVGNVPGLEVWDGRGWFAVEKEVEKAERKGASMLVGRQLERMSNGRYMAGGHRVVAYGSPTPVPVLPDALPNNPFISQSNVPVSQEKEKKYRFSIVFVLRAHEPVLLNSDELETEVTGKWESPIRGVTAGKFYDEIKGRHYNINVDVSEREKQRRKVQGEKEKGGILPGAKVGREFS